MILFLVAVPALVASLGILVLGGVGQQAWTMHGLAIGVAAALAAAGRGMVRRRRAAFPAVAILLLSLIGLAAPLASPTTGPVRWVSLGPLSLYVVPVLLPAFLVATTVCLARRGRNANFALMAMVGAVLILAVQPDASQALALLVASMIVIARTPSRSLVAVVALALAAAATTWAFTRPDPLQPIPHVEGVFALALGHSLLAGVATIAAAVVLVVGLHLNASKGRPALSSVAAYYAVLFGCSTAGLTPAPLIGYGAGPWIGFGLMAAVSFRSGEAQSQGGSPQSPVGTPQRLPTEPGGG